MSWIIINGDARSIPLKDQSVHTVCTSPPFWALRDYKLKPMVWQDGWTGILGLEPTPELYIQHLVEIFREVRRVLRSDGVVFLNLGDSYSSGDRSSHTPLGLKPLDLCGIPWRVAFALQTDGWWLRSDNIWNKLNPMPESINGWRWERHRVKLKSGRVARHGMERGDGHVNESNVAQREDGAEWAACPGCVKCKPNDGLVLRKGSWRPTRSHEYIFMLTKTDDYFCDAETVREDVSGTAHARGKKDGSPPSLAFKMQPIRSGNRNNPSFQFYMKDLPPEEGRNLRSVWEMATQPFSEAHFATFPEELAEKCIKAGTSEKGCCAECGSPWVRVTERVEKRGPGRHDQIPKGRYDGKWANQHDQSASKRMISSMKTGRDAGEDHDNPFAPRQTVGWRPSCSCNAGHIACTVLDPFAGTGTTVLVADKLGRHGIGMDLKTDYVEIAKRRVYNDAPLLQD